MAAAGPLQAVEQLVPALHAGARIAGDDQLPQRRRPPVELGGHLQVRPPTVGIGQLGRHRQHQRSGQRPQVVGRCVLVLVEQGVAAGLCVAAVAVDDALDQALAVAEVVLDGTGVALAGGPVDLAQRHGLDAPGGEELLGGPHDPGPGLVATGRPRHGAHCCTWLVPWLGPPWLVPRGGGEGA
jgi:hypothetical protein